MEEMSAFNMLYKRKNKMTKVLELMPIDFDFYIGLPDFDRLEVVGDRYVFYGQPDASSQHYYVAGTGSSLPTGLGPHLQTVIFLHNGNRLVAHVFGVDYVSRLPGDYRIWRETVSDEFYLSTEVQEFVHLEELDNGLVDVWYITDGNYQGYKDHYEINQNFNGGNVFYAGQNLAIHLVQDNNLNVHVPTQTVTTSASPQAVPNGLAFMYEKKDGSQRMVRVSNVQFGVNSNGEQYINGYDLDRGDMRTFLLGSIVDFPTVIQ